MIHTYIWCRPASMHYCCRPCHGDIGCGIGDTSWAAAVMHAIGIGDVGWGIVDTSSY